MRRPFNFALALALAFQTLFSPFVAVAKPAGQAADTSSRAAQLLQTLTPAERVGQLFVVSFQGSSAAPDTDIYRLIVESHIGGVVLLASQDNFDDPSNLPLQVLHLTNAMQSAAGARMISPPANNEASAVTIPSILVCTSIRILLSIGIRYNLKVWLSSASRKELMNNLLVAIAIKNRKK